MRSKDEWHLKGVDTRQRGREERIIDDGLRFEFFVPVGNVVKVKGFVCGNVKRKQKTLDENCVEPHSEIRVVCKSFVHGERKDEFVVFVKIETVGLRVV